MKICRRFDLVLLRVVSSVSFNRDTHIYRWTPCILGIKKWELSSFPNPFSLCLPRSHLLSATPRRRQNAEVLDLALPPTTTTDEPMAGQNNSGSYYLDVKNDSIISSNIIFRGSVLRQIEEKRKPRKYIYIGSMHVDVTWISIALEKYLGKSGNFHIYKQLQAWCREMRDLHMATFLYY